MNCSCGSDYFFQSPIFQTAPDGRGNYMATDRDFPWIHGLTCAMCNMRYVVDAEPRGAKRLLALGSAEARELIESNRIDFGKSFDPRQNKDAVVG